MERALNELKEIKALGCVLLGDPGYYSRFGFKRAGIYGLGNEYQADESFMVLELRKGSLTTVQGTVKYQPEFKKANC